MNAHFSLLILPWIFLISIQLITVLAAVIQPALVGRRNASSNFPPVTIVMPLSGVDAELESNLHRLFSQDYPEFSIEFAVTTATDAAIPVAQNVMLQWPQTKAQIRIGESTEFVDLKVRNEYKSLAAATTEYVYIVDSNVSLSSDALRRLVALMRSGVGLVAAIQIGVRPANFAAAIEAAFLNGFEARFILAGATFGIHRITGKSMLLRWSSKTLDIVTAMFHQVEPEDTAIFLAMEKQGFKVRLADFMVAHPLGWRTCKDVWQRQVRWARYRRTYLPVIMFGEIISSLWMALLTTALAAHSMEVGLTLAMLTTLFIWYGAEFLLHLLKGWPLSAKLALSWPLRDALLLPMWILAFSSVPVSWRGRLIQVQRVSDLALKKTREFSRPNDRRASGGANDD